MEGQWPRGVTRPTFGYQLQNCMTEKAVAVNLHSSSYMQKERSHSHSPLLVTQTTPFPRWLQ